jgi:hypothetical protein
LKSAALLRLTTCVILGLSFLSVDAEAKQRQPRDAYAKKIFKLSHPCPATGERRGRCPGYIIDHVEPICAGGADIPRNMQWQTVKEAKAKDLDEKRQCAALKRQ